MKCEICNKEFNGQRGLSSHLRQYHNITTLEDFKEYYDKYISDEDLICPICKIYLRKFISFRDGYAKTCVDQVDENGKKLNCRAHWANKDKEKARQNSIRVMQQLKNTSSPNDPSKTLFDIKTEKWYNKMTEKDQNGKTKFDAIGVKVSDNHLKINPNTGLSNATSYSRKAAKSRKEKFFKNGKNLSTITAEKAAITVQTKIMSDGRSQLDHMIEKSVKSRMTTILPNGLSISKDLARKAYETKIKNGTLPKYYGYSKASEKVFEQIIKQFNLNESKCFYSNNEFQFIDKENQNVYRYDFLYIEDIRPIFIIEFQGNQYHIRESELETRKNETNPHGELLTEGFKRDQIKKSFIKENYPECKYFEIWEDTIEKDLESIFQYLEQYQKGLTK